MTAGINLMPEGRPRRRRLLISLVMLLVLIAVLVALLIIYVFNPTPLPELLPIDVDYAPHYLFSIYGVDQPIGVALSPDEETIYVSESGGQRLIKAFHRDGNVVRSFLAPGTSPASRSPVYLDTDRDGRIYVTDRLQHAIVVFDGDGTFLDTVLDPETTLAEYVAGSACGLQTGTAFSLDTFEGVVRCTPPGGQEQTLPFPDIAAWSPLGVRIVGDGTMVVTDVVQDQHRVEWGSLPSNLPDLSLGAFTGGETGQDPGQLLFPNVAVVDSMGRVYVTDGNNGRVSIWTAEGEFVEAIGTGNSDGSLSLPRGAAIDRRDRLHVVDAVGQDVKVYDVSGDTPVYRLSFGEPGFEDGQFNFPGDIAIDSSGRLYITDRENNRVQVWSY